MVPAVCRKGFISCLSPVKRVLQRLAEHGAQQIAAVNLDGEDRDVKLTLDVFERDVVQKDALAVAQHGLRNEQAAAEDFPPELGDEVAARDKARDEAEKQKEAVASGEQTDWKEAMKEWKEYYER